MPIVGWNCPVCKDPRASLDHYAVTECGLRIHPAYAAAIIHDDITDPHGKAMSVTDGLGCPRHAAINNQAGIYVNPLEYNALLTGRGWDLVVGSSDLDYTGEERYMRRAKVQLHGTIAGMEITGELDNVRRLGDRLILSDWKNSNNFRVKWIKQEGKPSAEYMVQTSIYAELYRQMFDEMPTDGEVVYHFAGAGNDVLLPFQYPIMPIAECLAFRPYGGQYSVEELYRMAAQTYPDSAEGNLGPANWKELPLVGETMAFGTKQYCDYCEVKDLCKTAARGAPF